MLLVGCGDLGTDIGMRLARRGHTVAGIRRRAELVAPPLIGVSADLTRETPQLPELALGYLVVALTARPRTTEAYQATYVEGMGRVLRALADAGQRPTRAVLISSTGVYGDLPPGTIGDEDTPAAPGDGPAQSLLAAEQLFGAEVPNGTVLRLSGLYGRGRSRFANQVTQGQITDPNRWTNRIHRDDAAAAVVHLLTRPAEPAPLYVGTDDEPALLGDVAAYVAARLGAPTPPPADPAMGHGRRLSNARLRASGWVPAYATYREGYRDSPGV